MRPRAPRRAAPRRAPLPLAASWLAALLLAAPRLVAPAPALAQAAPAELTGRVVHDAASPESSENSEGPENSEGSRRGVAGLRVELHRVTAAGGSVVDSTVSRPDGGFRFRLETDDQARPLYLAAVRYEGVRYFGPALHSGMNADEPYEVTVFDTTMVSAPPADLRVGVRHVVVTPDPEGGLDVAEVVDVIGPDDRTIVAASDTLALWSTALPDGARSPQVIEGGAPVDVVRFVGGRVELGSMVTPIGMRLSYTYGLDGDELELPVEHPTDRVEVVVAGAEAEVSGASHAETTTRNGRLIHRYEGTSLKPGERITIRLVAEGGGLDRWALAWAAIGFALLGGAVALARGGRQTA